MPRDLWTRLLAGAPHLAPPWIWLCLVVAFAVAESTQLHVELRRQTVSLSLSELPLVLGLFLVDPVTLLLVRLTGSLVVAGWRRSRAFKTAFNTVLFGLEVALAVTLFEVVRGETLSARQAWFAVRPSPSC